MRKMCEARCDAGGWYCTREKGHEGFHVATVGPYQPGAKHLTSWTDDRCRRSGSAMRDWENA